MWIRTALEFGASLYIRFCAYISPDGVKALTNAPLSSPEADICAHQMHILKSLNQDELFSFFGSHKSMSFS